MEKENKIFILKKMIGEGFSIEYVENELKTYQEIVGGYIEVPYVCDWLTENNIDVIVNDSGMIDGLAPNLVLVRNSEVVGCLHGNICFVSHDGNGNFTGLDEKQVKLLKESFSCGVAFDKDGNELATMVI